MRPLLLRTAVTSRKRPLHLARSLGLVVSALVLAVPTRAFAQSDESPSSLPPLPPPPDEPPPVAPPAPAAPPPAKPPPANAPSPASSSAETDETEPATTAHVPTLADVPKLLVLSVGFGISVPTVEGTDPDSGGLYAAGEFVLVPSMWFSPRLYGGVLFTSTDPSTCPTPGCDVSAKIGFLGIKGRLTIPIPYVAPFLELGLGMSVGTLTTRIYDTDVEFTGVTYHIPIAIGLSFGNMHNYIVDLALSYLDHPAQSQINGAFALSLAFSLK
jgi:hypothetical protein